MDGATLASIVAAAAPLVYASLGETISEKAGVVNLSLDGSILLSAMTGFAVGMTTGSVLLGFVAAALVSALMAAIVAISGIELNLNQFAVGFILFLLGTELSAFLGEPFVREPGPSVPRWEIPGLSELPFVGTVLFSHNLSVYGSFVLIVGSWWFFSRTRPGLSLQAVGERPEAAFARGIPVNRLRYLYAILGGALVGVAGAAFSLDQKLGWSEGHTTNFGWIALALVIFGGWNPLRVAFGCYLFGALQVLALKLQPQFPELSQILPIIPFPLMIFTLLLMYRPWVRRLADRHRFLRPVFANEPPGGLGVNFRRE
jgi:ABC-type uncharacterized transport system permease subunit